MALAAVILLHASVFMIMPFVASQTETQSSAALHISISASVQVLAAGAAHTYPTEAGQIRKGGYIMIKERPCKVSEVTSSKTGKHGHAKCHFVAIDIFTGKKIEDLVPASHTTYAPFVKKMEYQFLDVDEDGFISCMTEDGTQREDLKIPDAMSQPPPVRCAPHSGVATVRQVK